MRETAATSRLDGRAAIVTGAGNGIGRAIALALGAAGARISVADISGEAALRTAAEIEAQGGVARASAVDIADADAVENLVEQTAEAFCGLDILVNNAGIGGPMVRLHETDTADFNRVLDVNLRGTYLCTKQALPHLMAAGRGNIINIASTYGLVAAPKTAAYCTTKAGIVHLTKQLAVDYGTDGIRVNAICPGYIDTREGKDLPTVLPEELRQRQDRREAAAARQPLGRQGLPSEVAEVALFLSSESSSFMTGAILTVDGGCVTTFNYGEASN